MSDVMPWEISRPSLYILHGRLQGTESYTVRNGASRKDKEGSKLSTRKVLAGERRVTLGGRAASGNLGVDNLEGSVGPHDSLSV